MTSNSTNIHYNNLNNILYTTKEASEIINVSQSTLRKYEEKYSISVQRNEKGHRRYSLENINEFKEILKSRNEKKNKKQFFLDNANKYNEDLQNTIKNSIENNSYISLESQNDARRNFENYITNFTNELFEKNNNALLDNFNNCLNDKVDGKIEKLINLIKIENNQLRSENKRLMNMVYDLNCKVEILIQKEEYKNKPTSFNKLFSKNK
ncbi:MerR family transcriptional regulator [Tepidibacter hydrothermalis]|uniref:Helix-turn-helix domain-containing protein n=1 Tax=Tepidibacter hydrothermalis TaxID=3036126 RepID=A0ABY8EL41_9FIRM|nr:helix-turn-helix domain-containing protein [Tepidibacter hydrothermalis]WFD11968.1 helix-turn-helix domain-containing protein [Tepidibacter hydrothermalis]